MTTAMSPDRGPTTGAYVLGDQDRERERIDAQAALLRPATERLLSAAGISAGMRVLDAGTGTGEVALLVADLVGPVGSIVAIDRSPQMLAILRRRANDHGHRQIEAIEADLNALAGLGPFDAVVGRLILMHQPDPVATLRSLAGLVRPGGAIAFLEYHLLQATTSPYRPLCQEAYAWTVKAMQLAGVQVDLGLRLYSTFLAAGLPAPAVRLEPLVGTGEAPELHRLLAETSRTCLPLIERFGLASREEVAIETLEERLLAEARAIDGVTIGPVQGCAWTRLPA